MGLSEFTSIWSGPKRLVETTALDFRSETQGAAETAVEDAYRPSSLPDLAARPRWYSFREKKLLIP